MRPKSQKNKTKDWYRSRRWRAINWSEGDWRAQYPDKGMRHMYSYYPKKASRINGNRAVRRYKGEISNGCEYKKIYDVAWEVW